MTEAPDDAALAAGRGYEALFVPALFAPWTRHLIDGAGVRDGARVLDIACGSGVLARHALSVVGGSGQVTGLDSAPGMIAAAQEVEPRIDWVEAAAEDLPFDDASFDCAVSQFGMMFFQDRMAATSEMLRVLAPGGQVAVAVWDRIDRNPAYHDVVAILESEVGAAAADAVRVPFSLGDPDVVRNLLNGAGFTNVEVSTIQEQARFPTTRAMIEVELRGWLPLFDIHLDEEKIAEVLETSNDRLGKYASDTGEAVFPASAHIFTARKP